MDGAKGGGQGKYGLAKHAPNTASGTRVTGAGPHPASHLFRLTVKYPRWEPYAGKPHVPALCGGRIVICVPAAIRTSSQARALAKLPKAEPTADTVRRFLAEELSNGQPKLEQLASQLHMSARTLHRRLEQEGTNYRRVLTEVRHELAVRHLIERRLAIGEIAFLLGFSEVSAFHRAFRHWTGHAPHAYRALVQRTNAASLLNVQFRE